MMERKEAQTNKKGPNTAAGTVNPRAGGEINVNL